MLCIQHNNGSKTLHALCELHLHPFKDKLMCYFDYKYPKHINILQTLYQDVLLNCVYSVRKTVYLMCK